MTRRAIRAEKAADCSGVGSGADSVSSTTRLVIPNGYTEDRGRYALDLLRRDPALRAAVEG